MGGTYSLLRLEGLEWTALPKNKAVNCPTKKKGTSRVGSGLSFHPLA